MSSFTYAVQLDERQIECVDFDIFISDATKKHFFVVQMDKSGLFEPNFIGDYDDTPDKQWTMVVDLFTKKYDRKMRPIKREGENKDYKSMADLSGMKRGGAPQPSPKVDMETREYIAAIEERATLQDDHIKDIMDAGLPPPFWPPAK